jgi:hypothetical protein
MFTRYNGVYILYYTILILYYTILYSVYCWLNVIWYIIIIIYYIIVQHTTYNIMLYKKQTMIYLGFFSKHYSTIKK